MKDEIIFELQKRGAHMVWWDANTETIEARVFLARGLVYIRIYIHHRVLTVNDYTGNYSGKYNKFEDIDGLMVLLESNLAYFFENKYYRMGWFEALLPAVPEIDKTLKEFEFTIRPHSILLGGLVSAAIIILLFLFL